MITESNRLPLSNVSLGCISLGRVRLGGLSRGWRVAVVLLCLAPAQVFGQRDLTDIPKPDIVAELAAMQVADGWEVNLFASDPDFTKPIHMNWDAQGRLWIASSRNYPQLKPGAEPTDEIIVLQDTDGDGRSDQRTVFANDMMIPTGVLPGDGGVYVANSTQLIHLSDTDGDGLADKRRTILSGFGTEDTHHLLHTLRWRPDGRMAMNQSIYIHSHLETPYGVKHLDGGGIWHFDPFNSELDIFCKGFVNPWGHAINAYGQSLVTDGAYVEGINYAFPGAVFVTSPGATRWLTGLNPGSPKHCGLEFISGDAMPADMRDVLVTNDFRGHRVCRFKIERQGAGYRSTQLPDLIRSEHIAFRPIDVKMGPDGAIYIADWYNPIIQHGEVDFRDPRRDTEHGRIWRITAKGKSDLQRPNYSTASVPELVQLLRDPALWVQEFARQELSSRDAESVDQALAATGTTTQTPAGSTSVTTTIAAEPTEGKAIDTASSTASETAYLALQALWLQLAQHRLQPQLLDQLRVHSDARVRAAAMRVIGERQRDLSSAVEWLTVGVEDADDQVVLESICGLHRTGTLQAVHHLLKAAARDGKDQFLDFAIWNALRENESVWLPAFESGAFADASSAVLEALADAATTPNVARRLATQVADRPAAEQARIVSLVASRGDAESLAELTQWICGSQRSQASKSELLDIVLVQSQARKLPPSNVAAWLPSILQQANTADGDPVWLSSLARAAQQWQIAGSAATINEWLTKALDDGNLPVAAACLDALAGTGRAEDRQRVRTIVASDQLPIAMRASAVSALSTFDAAAASNQLLGIYVQAGNKSDLLPQEVRSAVAAILGRKAGREHLSEAVRATSASQWQAGRAREFLSAIRDSSQSTPELNALVMQATGLENAGWKLSTALTQRLSDMARDTGDAERGQSIYRREKLQCVRCHAIGQSGLAIGPNLVSLGGSAPIDYIIESLIDPAAKAKEGYQTLSVLLDTDEIINGLQQSKTADALQLLLADGTTRTVATDSIEAIRDGVSLMPAGLVDELTEQELADLIAFMSKLGRAPEYTVDTKSWVRNWQTLIWTPAANSRLNRTSLDTAATDDAALEWRLLSSRVDGSAPLDETSPFQPHGDVSPPTSFLRFDVNLVEAGGVEFKFTQPATAMSFWLDGQSRPAPAPDEKIDLGAGKHRIVIGARVNQINGRLACEVVGAGEKAAVVVVP